MITKQSTRSQTSAQTSAQPRLLISSRACRLSICGSLPRCDSVAGVLLLLLLLHSPRLTCQLVRPANLFSQISSSTTSSTCLLGKAQPTMAHLVIQPLSVKKHSALINQRTIRVNGSSEKLRMARVQSPTTTMPGVMSRVPHPPAIAIHQRTGGPSRGSIDSGEAMEPTLSYPRAIVATRQRLSCFGTRIKDSALKMALVVEGQVKCFDFRWE
ncbi:hypothetical protein F5Y12DRAFT_701113 [Xylaria sp. FL1777]|nr:hypothetical protein F5Y12DRAFT_701113 [Xylaria sp. FL1777]